MKKLALLLFLFASAAAAQVAVLPFRTPRATFTDPNGVPLADGCVFTYAGGTSTPQATYTDYTGTISNPNPVILDSTGSAVMWLGPETYKFIAFSSGGTNCSTGVQQWTVDQVPGSIWVGGTISGVTITDSTIINSTIDNSPIGDTTPAPVNATYFSGPIGLDGGTPAAGLFTEIAGVIDQMAFSATPVFNAGSYTVFTMTLTGNVASSSVSGGLTSQFIQFNICQNSAGGFTFAWPANFVNAPPIPSVASTCASPMFFYDGTNWQYVNELGPQSVAAYDNVTFSATPVFPVDPATIFAFTLSANVTSSTITGSVLGQQISFFLCQNGTGGYSFVWPTSFINPPSMPEAPGACITPSFFYNGTSWIQSNLVNVPSSQTVAFSATPTFDSTSYNQFAMTLTGNVTSSTITGGYFGQIISFAISQDGTGGRTFVWPTNVVNPPTISPTASSTTNVVLIFSGTTWFTAGAVTPVSSAMTNCLASACIGGSTYTTGTTYTNLGSVPVLEEVAASQIAVCSGAGFQITTVIAGTAGPANGTGSCSNFVENASVTFMVPPGDTFEVTITNNGTTGTLQSWLELPVL